jgi:hypothetical protein
MIWAQNEEKRKYCISKNYIQKMREFNFLQLLIKKGATAILGKQWQTCALII